MRQAESISMELTHAEAQIIQIIRNSNELYFLRGVHQAIDPALLDRYEAQQPFPAIAGEEEE